MRARDRGIDEPLCLSLNRLIACGYEPFLDDDYSLSDQEFKGVRAGTITHKGGYCP